MECGEESSVVGGSVYLGFQCGEESSVVGESSVFGAAACTELTLPGNF